MNIDLAQHPFTEVLERIAATTPAPGGGTASALAVALGMACGAKAVNVSLKHSPQSATLRAASDTLQTLSAEVLALADADATAFEQLLAAYKLPKATPPEQQVRRAAIAATAAAAAEVGRSIIAVAQRAAVMLGSVKDEIHANILGDFAAAHHLFVANQAIQQQNIDENLAIAARFQH